MRVKFLQSISSSVYGAPAIGSQLDIDDKEAKNLIKAGIVEPVQKKKRTADKKPTYRKAVK